MASFRAKSNPKFWSNACAKFRKASPGLTVRRVSWVLSAYRTQGSRPAGSRPKVQLTPKESLIVSCVTQGMKNKEIALRVGTTEQVVKNYLRKVYDKLGRRRSSGTGALLPESPGD